MSKKDDYHVVPHSDGWAVRRENSGRASSIHDVKQGALDAGRALAQAARVELVIHGKDGVIQNSNSFGNDPNPPKDRKH